MRRHFTTARYHIQQACKLYNVIIFFLEFHHQDLHERHDRLEKKLDAVINHLAIENLKEEKIKVAKK